MKEKINVGILFGGKSAEHEVSLQSAKNVYEAINRNKYNPILIGITKNGEWLLCDSDNYLLNADNPETIALKKIDNRAALVPGSSGKISNLNRNNAKTTVDVVFPILHGPLGEDGTVQGLLKLADIPFVGAGVLGSAVGMDKDIMKRLLRDAGIQIGDFLTIKAEDKKSSYKTIARKLGKVYFAKPANMGSSVGVNKVSNEKQHQKAIKEAFKYDNKVVVEEYIKGRELECAVLGNNDPIASTVGEVIPNHDFYSYEAKYIDENGAALKIPAELPAKTIEKIQKIAISTFKTLNCEGLGRVDFFLQKDGKIIVNEINTIPGFTKISMYPKLWEASGISYSELIDRLIQLAIGRYAKEKRIRAVK